MNIIKLENKVQIEPAKVVSDNQKEISAKLKDFINNNKKELELAGRLTASTGMLASNIGVILGSIFTATYMSLGVKSLDLSPEITEKLPMVLQKVANKIIDFKTAIFKLMKNNKKKSLAVITPYALFMSLCGVCTPNNYQRSVLCGSGIISGKIIYDLIKE